MAKSSRQKKPRPARRRTAQGSVSPTKPTTSKWSAVLGVSLVGLVLVSGAVSFTGWRAGVAPYDDSAVRKVGRDQALLAAIPEPSASPRVLPTPHPPTTFAIPVLTYHYVRNYHNPLDRLGTELSVEPIKFQQQLDYLQSRGFTTMSFSDLYYGRVPPKPVILTFDDGYKDSFTEAFPALVARHMKGTFYVVSGFVGNSQSVDWSDLKVMKKAGMEIGAHTIKHADLPLLSADQQRKEIVGSIESIDDHLHMQVLTFAYPAGRSNDDSVRILQQAAIPYAVKTTFGAATSEENPLLLSRFRILPETDLAALLH